MVHTEVEGDLVVLHGVFVFDLEVGVNQVRIVEDHHAELGGPGELLHGGESHPEARHGGKLILVGESFRHVPSEAEPLNMLFLRRRGEHVAKTLHIVLGLEPRLDELAQCIVGVERNIVAVRPVLVVSDRGTDIARGSRPCLGQQRRIVRHRCADIRREGLLPRSRDDHVETVLLDEIRDRLFTGRTEREIVGLADPLHVVLRVEKRRTGDVVDRPASDRREQSLA